MNITIKINTDNAAFEDGSELSRILHKLADKVDGRDDTTIDGIRILDINGNIVGKVVTD